MSGYRFRVIDSWTFRYLNKENAHTRAADEIIETPEKHLMTQEEVLQAEGGPVGLAVQAGAVATGLGALFAYNPHLLVYLRRAQLRPAEWAILGATSIASYYAGHYIGTMVFGNQTKLHNHRMAYHYVKTLNRFEGRQILTKKPMNY